MITKIYTPPLIEPVSLQDMREHLRLDSGNLADNLVTVQSIAPGWKNFINDWTTHAGASVDVLGYSAVVNFEAGIFAASGTVDVKIQDSDDNITFNDWSPGVFTQVTTSGMLTSAALGIGTTLTNVANGIFTYFIAGTGYSKPANAAGTSPVTGGVLDTIPQGKYGAMAFEIGIDNVIDVVAATANDTGYTTVAFALAGLPADPVSGHVRIGTVTAMRSAGGAFVFGTTALNAANTTVAYTQATLKANYNTTYEKAYTGAKQYIKAVAKVLVADCSFSVPISKYATATTEDMLLTALITAARQQVEAILQRQLITATWDAYLDEFPDKNFISLPFGQLQDVASVEYTDSDGTPHSMAETIDYLVDYDSDPGRIVLPYGVSWPFFTEYSVNPIAIEFDCGYGDNASDVPAGIRTAIKMLVEDMYNNRSATNTQAAGNVTENKAVLSLLYPYRLWSF